MTAARLRMSPSQFLLPLAFPACDPRRRDALAQPRCSRAETRGRTRSCSGVLLTFVLGQLISNMATALIVLPVAVSAADELDVSAKPVLMAVAVASAAAS